MLSRVWFFVTPWAVAHQAPLSTGILQARMLEWVAYSFSRGSSRHRNWTRVSCITGRFLTSWAAREAQEACDLLKATSSSPVLPAPGPLHENAWLPHGSSYWAICTAMIQEDLYLELGLPLARMSTPMTHAITGVFGKSCCWQWVSLLSTGFCISASCFLVTQSVFPRVVNLTKFLKHCHLLNNNNKSKDFFVPAKI